MTLKYTKPLQFKTILALKDSEGNIVVSIKAKEALVRKSAFPYPPPNLLEPLAIPFQLAHTKITEKTMAQALLSQAVTKVPGIDKIKYLDPANDMEMEKDSDYKYGLSCYMIEISPHGIKKGSWYTL